MIRAIGLINGATGWTGPARIPRINEDHRYTRQAGLIANQRLELPEAPVSELCPLVASGRNPCAYPLELFKGIARPVRCACCTIRLLISWLICF